MMLILLIILVENIDIFEPHRFVINLVKILPLNSIFHYFPQNYFFPVHLSHVLYSLTYPFVHLFVKLTVRMGLP
jgi:hypothetical protein